MENLSFGALRRGGYIPHRSPLTEAKYGPLSGLGSALGSLVCLPKVGVFGFLRAKSLHLIHNNLFAFICATTYYINEGDEDARRVAPYKA
jgi:hypothetical protein